MEAKDLFGIGNMVKDVIYLTEVNENDTVVINTKGFLNQIFFSNVCDALYYLFISYKGFTVEKRSDTYIKIKTTTHSDKTKYHILKMVEPLKY